MRLLVFLFPILFLNCSPTESTLEDDRKTLNKQLSEIKALIAEGACDENTSCYAIGVGSKACGGPKTYLVYSSSIDVDALESKVEAYNRAENEFNEKHGATSDCAIVSPPDNIGCKDGKCVMLEE